MKFFIILFILTLELFSNQTIDTNIEIASEKTTLIPRKVVSKIEDISTKPCHSFHSSMPLYFLEKLENNQGYQYVFNNSPFYLSSKIILSLFIIFALFRRYIGASIIALILYISITLFQSYMGGEKMVFDTNKTIYYKQIKDEIQLRSYISFDDIRAIQLLIYEECHTDMDEEEICGEAYELNLVLNDNDRINIECHTDYNQIIDNLSILEKILKKPVLHNEEI